MTLKISRKEWEEFLEWKRKKEKETEKKEMIEFQITKSTEALEENIYVCPKCGFSDKKQFDICQNCKTKLYW